MRKTKKQRKTNSSNSRSRLPLSMQMSCYSEMVSYIIIYVHKVMTSIISLILMILFFKLFTRVAIIRL